MGAIEAMRSLKVARTLRLARAGLALVACLGALPASARAQTPPPAEATPGTTPGQVTPATPTPVVPAPPAPAPPAPSSSQAAPTAPPPPGGPQQTVFTGEGVVLATVPVLSKTGSSSWDEGYDAIVTTLKDIQQEMTRLGLTQAGDVFVVYTQADDAGFEFDAQIPFSGATTSKPGNDVRLASSFAGKALKFQHKGSFADMDDTYEQIANFLDARNITALELYIEQYKTDPRTTPPDQLLLDILVPIR